MGVGKGVTRGIYYVKEGGEEDIISLSLLLGTRLTFLVLNQSKQT